MFPRPLTASYVGFKLLVKVSLATSQDDALGHLAGLDGEGLQILLQVRLF